jgi:hypothetical protein
MSHALAGYLYGKANLIVFRLGQFPRIEVPVVKACNNQQNF